MGRQRSPNRAKAYEIFEEHKGRITSSEIADQLGEKVSNINSWRSKDKWKEKLNGKIGAPYGNKNAVGNSGGGAPELNQNSYIHGFYSKYLPKKTYDIMKEIEGMDPIDILWQNICIKYAAIVRSQKIMYVTSKREMIKELKKQKTFDGELSSSEEIEYEFQFAWDRQATFLNAQSRAMAQLTSMIKQYDEMIHRNWDTVTEEQKARVEKIRNDIELTKKKIDEISSDDKQIIIETNIPRGDDDEG